MACTAVAAPDITQPLPAPPAIADQVSADPDPAAVAARALGPLAAEFAERTVQAPYFMGPQDQWTVWFLSPPQLIHPGLCGERMLVVPLKREVGGDKIIRWRPQAAAWQDRFRIVGPFGDGPAASDQLKACQDTSAFKIVYSGNALLSASSAQQAWDAGLLLQAMAGAARRHGPLPFALACSSKVDPSLCRSARKTLAAMIVQDLSAVHACWQARDDARCVGLDVQAHANRRDGGYWSVEAMSSLADPRRPEAVRIAYEIDSKI